MVTEQGKTLEALKTAIQMEIDGKEHYLKASEQSSNPMGKDLLKSLAAEEDMHRQKFEKIYNAIQAKKAWPDVKFKPDGGKGLRTILANAAQSSIVKEDGELEALQTAIKMEIKTHDFYKSQGEKAVYGAEKEFYEKLAGEEREHQLVLLDYYEYLKDPAGWFVSKEHPSLDAG